MREKILAVLLVVVMTFSLLSLSACGNTGESPSPDATESPADSESIAPSESPELSEFPEPSESPEQVIPYAEANGLSFSREKGYTIPAFTCLTNPSSGEPTSFDELSITGVVDASYTIGDISVSEADADGMVQVIVPYHVEFTTTVTDTSLYGVEFGYAWSFLNAGLFDYYTGIVIPTDGTLSEDAILENTIDITYQDVTYPIAYTRSQTDNDSYSDWVDVGGGTYKLPITVSSDLTYTIHMPKEYDGLCLFLYLPGKTELADTNKEDSSASEVTFLEGVEDAEEDINDYALIRVSDLM